VSEEDAVAAQHPDSRECVTIEVDTLIRGERVVRALDRLAGQASGPKTLS
jgi:hypothetical protein